MRAIVVFAKAFSESIVCFVIWAMVFCHSGAVGGSILLAHSLEVIISILNHTIHDDADFLLCRAFFRRLLQCYCRLLVSDYVPFSFSNQFVVIGLRMNRRFRQLSFPSVHWFGDEIWIFDPGIVGSQIDNEEGVTTWFMPTPDHHNVSRQGNTIWWREIMLCLILRLYNGKFLPSTSMSIKELGRPSIVSLRIGEWISGTRFIRGHSSLHHFESLTITMVDVTSCCGKGYVGKRSIRRSITKLWKQITCYVEVGALFVSALILVDFTIRMRIRRSDQQQVWVYITITQNYISFFRRVPKSKVLRCNGWIADFVFRRRKRWFIDKEKMFPKLERHTRLTDRTKATKHIIRIAVPELFCFFVTRICYCNYRLMLNIVIFYSP